MDARIRSLVTPLLLVAGCQRPAMSEAKRPEECIPPHHAAATAPTEATPAQTARQHEDDVGDVDLGLAIRMKLASDDGIVADRIDVAVVDGIVTLQGDANSTFERRRAVKLAKLFRGVRSVVDDLQVGGDAVPDDQIRSDVLFAFLLDPAVEGSDLAVQVKNGEVSLSGAVHSWAEKDLAEELAYATRGVRNVRNHIEVRYEADRRDSEIAHDVERASRTTSGWTHRNRASR